MSCMYKFELVAIIVAGRMDERVLNGYIRKQCTLNHSSIHFKDKSYSLSLLLLDEIEILSSYSGS